MSKAVLINLLVLSIIIGLEIFIIVKYIPNVFINLDLSDRTKNILNAILKTLLGCIIAYITLSFLYKYRIFNTTPIIHYGYVK